MKNNKGITLIALVVTIIVLLILAGIAINLTIGNNGLFKRAEDAAEVSRKEDAREKLSLVLADVQINRISLGKSLNLSDDLASEIEGYKEVTSAKLSGKIIEAVVNGYTFEVNGDLGIDSNKEIEKVEPDDISYWEYNLEEIPGYAVLTKYKGPAVEELVVPNYIAGVPVKKVLRRDASGVGRSIFDDDLCTVLYWGTGEHYIYRQESVTSIIISEGIEELGFQCFKDVYNLNYVSIPESVTTIAREAFNNELVFNPPENIPDRTCTFNIPSSVKNIEGWVFSSKDIVNVEFQENEIPSTWESYWNGSAKVNYGVKM